MAVDISSDTAEIESVALGAEQAVDVPLNTRAVVFFANGGDATVAFTSGGTAWPIQNGTKETWAYEFLQNKNLYVAGSGTLYLLYLKVV